MQGFQKVQEVLADKPVAPLAQTVVNDVMAGKVAVLAAPTGSGKSLLVSSLLADSVDEPVLVLVPRRLLATDAAANIAEMSQTKVGDQVGYAIGSQSGDESQYSANTRLLFATYGYALTSGLINRAKHVVLDEVHEVEDDMSLARAILYERVRSGEDVNLLEMSATVSAQKQAGYWADKRQVAVHTIGDQTLQYDERVISPHDDDTTIEDIAFDLLRHEGRKGIGIFMQGVGEVERMVEALKVLRKKYRMNDLEIEAIYGDMDPVTREKATRPPREGNRKIVVGTNVIESGVNLRWIDSGISNGIGKIPYDREDTGAEALVPEDLPRWRVVQQRGRINRDPQASGFDEGIFVLFTDSQWGHRQEAATPEMQRRALTQLAFRAACLGYDPTRLKFEVAITPHRWQQAKEELMRLELIHDDWTLTPDGQYAAGLPVSPDGAAMLAEAWRMDEARRLDGRRPRVLYDAIALTAIFEVGGLRADYKKSHGLDRTSDLLDALKAFRALGDYADQAQCEMLNVSWKRYNDVRRMIDDLHRRHYSGDLEPREPASDRELQRVVLAGGANHLFQGNGSYRDLLRDYGNRRNDKGKPFDHYEPSEVSVVKDGHEGTLVVGQLREIPPNDRYPDALTILTNLTIIPTDVFLEWAAERSDPILTGIALRQEQGRHKGRKAKHGRDGVAQVLEATYADRAGFSLHIPRHSAEHLDGVIAELEEKENQPRRAANGDHRPRGCGNSAVLDVGRQERRMQPRSRFE